MVWKKNIAKKWRSILISFIPSNGISKIVSEHNISKQIHFLSINILIQTIKLMADFKERLQMSLKY